MHIAKSILLLLSGAIAGIALVISCGDNLHLSADAAIDAPKVTDAAPACDCPAAEPPLAGRLVVSSSLRVMGGNSQAGTSVFCPVGTQLISGSCTISNAPATNDVVLLESGFRQFPPTAWHCAYRNNEPVSITYETAVMCLKPAP